MKNYVVFISILLLFLFTTANSQVIDEPYDFPIKPGTPEWVELHKLYEDNLSEIWKLLEIPDDILKRLSTRALVETCLNYPRFSEFRASSSNPKDGVSWVMKSFNGFGELFLRQDAFTYLFVKYELFDLKMEEVYYSKFYYPDILLSQDEIIKGMSYDEKILLLKESYSKLEKIMAHDKQIVYIDPFTPYLMATLLLAIDDPDITSEINNSEDITFLLNTMRVSYNVVNRLKELVNNVIQKVIQNSAIININKPEEIPTTYSLLQNYPNPFNPTTTIQYTIPKDEFVKLTVYDITGKVVKELVNGYKSAGKYSVEFNASSYASGTYYYTLEAGEYKSMQKMMLVK